MEPPVSTSPVPRAAAPTWGVADALVGWLVVFTSGQFFGLLLLNLAGYGVADGKPIDDAPITLSVVVSYLPLWVGLVGVPAYVAWAKGRGLVEDFKLKVRAVDVVGIPIGLLAQVVMVPVVSYPVLWLSGTDVDKLSEPARELADKAQASSTIGVVVFFAIVVIGAPIAEEIFFRGLVLRAFERRFGAPVGLLVSSLLFGFTHFQPLQFPALVVAGAIFGWLALRFDRLGPAILCHMAFNATTAVTILWLT